MKAYMNIVSILLVFLMVLSLCACTKKEETDKNEWVNVVEIREGAISDTGYYYLNQGLLHYVDFQNGVNVCLCSKAGCTHDDSECEAEIMLDLGGVFSTMFFWNGGIYFTTFGEYGWGLYRRNADGTGESKVATLCEKYMKEDPEIEVDAYFFTVAGNYVYYYGQVKAVVMQENITTSQTKLNALLRLDLRTGKEEILAECYEKNKGLRLVAVRNDSAIYTLASYPGVYYGDENYNALAEKCQIQLLQWSEETGESKVLLDKTWKEIGDSITYAGGEFFCYPEDVRHSINLETGALTRVEEMNDLLIINADYGFLYDEEADMCQVKNLKTGEVLPNEYGKYLFRFNIKCYSDDMLILTYRVENEDGSKDDHYMFVTAESLADGLQKEDATEFYVRHYSGL